MDGAVFPLFSLINTTQYNTVLLQSVLYRYLATLLILFITFHKCCRQNKALDHFDKDAEELVFRVGEANRRGRRLLRK